MKVFFFLKFHVACHHLEFEMKNYQLRRALAIVTYGDNFSSHIRDQHRVLSDRVRSEQKMAEEGEDPDHNTGKELSMYQVTITFHRRDWDTHHQENSKNSLPCK